MLGRRVNLESFARMVTIVACLWFAFAAAWGLFQIPGGGHSGAGTVGHAAASYSMLKWKIVYPIGNWYTQGPPTKADYYCHHPFGTFWYSALYFVLFGHHDFTARLPTVVLSALIPVLLYGIGKQHWGAGVGAVAACAYVVVPIAIGFANFDNVETLGIFGSLLFFWGHSRQQVTRARRHTIASVVGLFACCSADWYGYVTVAPLLGWAFLRAFVLPKRWTPRLDFPTYARWWALSVVAAVGSLALWIALFYKADRIGDWLASGDMRGGDGTPLKAVLQARANWLNFSFTPVAITLGKIAVPIALLRVVLLRRDEELYALCALAGAAFEYMVFKRGADVHIFWPHPFAEYYALAVAQLSATAGALARTAARAMSPPARATAIGKWTALVLGLLPSVVMAPDAARSLVVWRRTGGRYDDNGAPIRSDVDLLYVVRKVVVPHKSPRWTIDIGIATGWGWEHAWAFDGDGRHISEPDTLQPATSTHPFWVARASTMSSSDQTRIAAKAHVQVYGDIWVVDQRTGPAPIDAWSLNERQPNPVQWLLFGGWEPVRSIARSPDPLRTWEWRYHLGQPASVPQSVSPSTIDDLRILHNAALSTGAIDQAALLEQRIESQLDRSVAAPFEHGVRLLGVRFTESAQSYLEVWWQSVGHWASDDAFRVRSSIEARAPWSLIPVDTVDREMVPIVSFPTRLWREGFIYHVDFALNHRIGRERYSGAWLGMGAPRRIDGRPETTLAVLR
ncbi:MAG TPA: glycosyltransferase family 39 protein [Polyangiaceae bacterium]|nr:glycosyltransferase family 39 protein [Polyangiaceae bacterium]